jgi:hypothetical protein
MYKSVTCVRTRVTCVRTRVACDACATSTFAWKSHVIADALQRHAVVFYQVQPA